MANYVAEIGINHNGSLDAAIAMVEAIDADYVKFQKLDPDSFVPLEARDRPHPRPENAFGPTYYEHKKFLEFSVEDHKKIREAAKKSGKGYALSVFDIQSLKDAYEIKPAYVKIPSCRAMNLSLINAAKEIYPDRLHISTGMMSVDERSRVRTANRGCVIYATNSDYSGQDPVPIPPSTDYGGISIHRPDISYGLIGAVKGFEWIEYHVTADRNLQGTDHKISLTIAEWNLMVRIGRGIGAANYTTKMPEMISQNESLFREKLWRTS